MGIDNNLICEDCKEHMTVARNGKLCLGTLRDLEEFFDKHADHYLIYANDDNWLRVRFI